MFVRKRTMQKSRGCGRRCTTAKFHAHVDRRERKMRNARRQKLRRSRQKRNASSVPLRRRNVWRGNVKPKNAGKSRKPSRRRDVQKRRRSSGNSTRRGPRNNRRKMSVWAITLATVDVV